MAGSSERGGDRDAAHGDQSPPVDGEELAALRAMVEGTAHHTGEAFFASLVRHLAAAVGVAYAFVAEFAGPTRVRTLAYWGPHGPRDNVAFEVAGTPCEDVVRGRLCHYPSGVRERFPGDAALVKMGIDSYLGVPLVAADGAHLGHLTVFDTRPLPPEPRKLFTFRVFAARAAAELERLRAERLLRESEARYRDLYDEAPIAYLYEDLRRSRFVHANRAAAALLGLRPEEVPLTSHLGLVAPTPEAQTRARAAIDALARGEELACVEVELRRRDDGRPVWVQWYAKPEPDGRCNRSMLIDVTDRVLVERERARLEQQNVYLQEEIKAAHNFDEIVGRSGPLVAVLEQVRRVAPTDASVLIVGETGTGKELVARAVHSHSARRGGALIKVNCAALPTGLVESELFGHERGAFTGAIARRVGRFELAHGGTLFLDEVGEVPLEVQAKLLRVLQEREFERVGGAGQPIKVDVRLIAATNRDLLKAVRDGTFREDLYYRLTVFPVHLPPLRERRDDVPLLVQFLVAKFAARIGKRVTAVAPATLRRLIEYPWPGNVRELENLLERAIILMSGDVLDIDPHLIGPAPAIAAPVAPAAIEPAAAAAVPSSLEHLERQHIVTVLDQTRWVIEGPHGAARILDLHPNTLRSRMKKLGLRRPTHAHS